MLRVAIHQSQYLPWPPYLKKIANVDVFVLMDNVQYEKNGVQNRNRIRNQQTDFWLTIPVSLHLGDTIRDLRFGQNDWRLKHWKSIQACYGRSPSWGLYGEDLERLFGMDYANLAEVNEAFLLFILRSMSIRTRIVRLSDLEVTGQKSELVLAICKTVGATVYVSGMGAKSYIQEERFASSGIQIEFRESIPPAYAQFNGVFIPGLSMLDMMCNVTAGDIQRYFES